MIDFDEIRKEIAIEHNVLLDRDDPILVAVTLHNQVLQQHVETLAKQNDAYRKSIEAAQKQGIADAKQTASKIITEASDYVSEQVNTAVTAAFDEGLEKIRKSQEVKEKEVNYWLDPIYWLVAFLSCTTLYFGLYYFHSSVAVP